MRAARAPSPTAGTMPLIGTHSRTGSGHGLLAASIAACSHGSDRAWSYSRKGLNSAQPAGPSISIP